MDDDFSSGDPRREELVLQVRQHGARPFLQAVFDMARLGEGERTVTWPRSVARGEGFGKTTLASEALLEFCKRPSSRITANMSRHFFPQERASHVLCSLSQEMFRGTSSETVRPKPNHSGKKAFHSRPCETRRYKHVLGRLHYAPLYVANAFLRHETVPTGTSTSALCVAACVPCTKNHLLDLVGTSTNCDRNARKSPATTSRSSVTRGLQRSYASAR